MFSRLRTHLPPALAIIALALAIMARLLMTPDAVAFREPLIWGYVNWAHRFPVLLGHFKAVFLHGTLYPRWLPELMGGNGYPTFLFYQPGSFFFSLPFALLTPDMVLATKLALLAMLLLAGAGAYRLAHLFTGRAGATACAALYLLNPYLIANLYLRAAYSELFAMILLPWCGYYAFRLQREWIEKRASSSTALGLLCSLAALGSSHPFVSLYFAPVFALLVVCLWLECGVRAWRLLLAYALCGIGAAVAAAPYLLTVLQMRDEIDYTGIQFTFLAWLMPLRTIITANPAETLLALLGLMTRLRSCVTWGLLIAWAGLFFTQATASYGVWQSFGPLRMTQLPYRALSSNAFILLIGCAFAFSYLERILSRPALPWALAALAAACIGMAAWRPLAIPPSPVPFSWHEMRARLVDENHAAFVTETLKHYDDQSLHHDFIPKRANLPALEKEPPFSRPLAWADGRVPAALQLDENATVYDIRFDVAVPDSPEIHQRPAIVHIRQLFLRGWQVSVNGQTQTPQVLAHDGSGDVWGWDAGDDARIRLTFYEPGEYHVHAYFEGPPHWLMRNMAMAFLLLAIYAALESLLRSRSRAPLEPA